MTDDELFLSLIEDKINECEQKSVITYTDFLDLRKQSMAVTFLKKHKGVKWLFYGGYEEAQRRIIVFLPFYIDDFYSHTKTCPEDNPVVVFRADKDGFSSPGHRDYLGALTGLGIKREKTGDIITDEKGCWFFALNTVAGYIKNNFFRAGRGTLSVRECTFDNSFHYQPNVKEKLCFVQSMRLDGITAAVYGLSRSKASEFIEKGLVFVNDSQILKPDYHIEQDDKIVIKGKGRVIVKDASGRSKKGRTAVIVDVFV